MARRQKPLRANVAASVTSVVLMAENERRAGLSVLNDSPSAMAVTEGDAASFTACTVIIPPGGFWEMPDRSLYDGVVNGIWLSAASGAARVTERY